MCVCVCMYVYIYLYNLYIHPLKEMKSAVKQTMHISAVS